VPLKKMMMGMRRAIQGSLELPETTPLCWSFAVENKTLALVLSCCYYWRERENGNGGACLKAPLKAKGIDNTQISNKP